MTSSKIQPRKAEYSTWFPYRHLRYVHWVVIRLLPSFNPVLHVGASFFQNGDLPNAIGASANIRKCLPFHILINQNSGTRTFHLQQVYPHGVRREWPKAYSCSYPLWCNWKHCFEIWRRYQLTFVYKQWTTAITHHSHRTVFKYLYRMGCCEVLIN